MEPNNEKTNLLTSAEAGKEEEKKKREELELLMIDEVRVECGSEG